MEDMNSTVENNSSNCDTNEQSSIFSSLYKCTSTKNDQESRRIKLLNEIKLRRSNLVNGNRGITDKFFKELKEECETNEETDLMDVESIKPTKPKKRGIDRAKLMMSEWLTDIPYDLEQSWFIKLCPKGSRCLVISQKQITKAYSWKGLLRSKFCTCLPGGSPQTTNANKRTVLDCIYNRNLNCYFVLDVLMWNDHDVTNCDTEFRFFFLKCKLAEIVQDLAVKFVEVDSFMANILRLEKEINSFPVSSSTVPQLDGLLFYHKGTPYIIGRNPLVGWLKPHMLPEKFGITIPTFLLKSTSPPKMEMEVT